MECPQEEGGIPLLRSTVVGASLSDAGLTTRVGEGYFGIGWVTQNPDPVSFGRTRELAAPFASVSAVPMMDDRIDVNISDSDLEWDFFRSSGAGGQAVNKLETAVRVTHRPSGLIVTCQETRYQRTNRDIALKMLRSKLYDIELRKKQDSISSARDSSENVSFGSQIRSYVLSGNRMVKDHRTKLIISDVEGVMNGNIDELIHSFLMR